MRKKAKKKISFTKDKKISPEIQKRKLDIEKQGIDKPACFAPPNESETENNISVSIQKNNSDFLSQQLPEDEKAVTDKGAAEKENRIWERMNLSPIWKMGQIKNALNDSLFALIIEDTSSDHIVNFCQRYRNGSFSPIMSIRQSDMIMSITYISEQGEKSEFNNTIKKSITKFKNNLCKEYFGKFRGAPEDVYQISDIINTICRALPLLPRYKDDETELKRRMLYHDIINRVSTYLTQHMTDIGAYYALTEDDIVYLADDLKQDKISLLRQMRNYGFLYIQSSASGFQSNIRLKRPDGTTYTEWRYCIYKIKYFMGGSGTDENDMDGYIF